MTALPMTEQSQTRWTNLLAAAMLILIVALVVFVPSLRSLATATWHELREISWRWLGVIAVMRIGQAVFAALSWHYALRASFPRSNLPFRFVLGLDQGQDALNTLTPARAGTITLFAALRMTIRGATIPKLVGVLTIQGIPFFVFGVVLTLIVAIGLPNRAQSEGGLIDSITGFVTDHPGWTTLIIGALVVAAAIGMRFARSKIEQTWGELQQGLALLGSPVAFLRLVALPAFGSYLFRWGGTMALMAAFGIPVTFWSVALAISSGAISGAVRVTPGGIGPSQALDVIALSAYAPPETITAFSLASLAVSAVSSVTLAIFGLAGCDRGKGLKTFARARRKAETESVQV